MAIDPGRLVVDVGDEIPDFRARPFVDEREPRERPDRCEWEEAPPPAAPERQEV